MSVQAGIWNFDGRPVDSTLLSDFSEYLKQQGPDGESTYVDGSIAFLYRPFHTTAESRREKQPYRSRRDFILTWDGRLDNREELIRELGGDTGADRTDVAIVADAFDRWQTDSFRRIIGDWAISVWKPGQRELVFAADYMAIRHIFYYLKRSRIYWSTELAPLVLLTGDRFHIDDNYVNGYFTQQPDAHLTPYCEIREVPPGHFVCVCNSNALVMRYWSYNPKSRIRYRTDTEYEDHFRHIFRHSVRRRLRSDTSVLAELSGGLDSSSIVCVADDVLEKEGTLAPHLDTLSYHDKTEPNGDDWIYFQQVEAYRGRVGHHIDASTIGGSPAATCLSEFRALPGHVSSLRTLEAERASVVRTHGYRVVLSGLGGDEFMGGIPSPNAQLADLIMQFKIVTLAQQLIAWSLVKRRPCIQLLRQATMALMPSFTRRLFSKPETPDWIKTQLPGGSRRASHYCQPRANFGFWLPTRRSCIATAMFIANKLAKLPTPVLAAEEVRYPFLDQNLIEFVLSIPSSQLLRPGERRSLMRRSLAGIVPNEILARRTKQIGARTPLIALERNSEELRSPDSSLLSASLGYVNPDPFLEALKAAIDGKMNHTISLLRTVSFEFWLRALLARDLIDGSPQSSLALASEPTTTSRGVTAR